MKRWMILKKGGNFTEIGEKFHIHPRIASLIRNRNIIGEEAINHYLNGTRKDFYNGMLLKDMEKAISILCEKIKNNKKIRIIGDYDIDGIQATYILLEGIRRLGGTVDSDIPNRMIDGYGLNRRLIEQAFQDGVDTIVTCDNGIAAREEIALAKSLKMTVIITDHHEVPYEETEAGKNYVFPDADAVIDPKRADCAYPFKGLCGAAVAYKLIEALSNTMGYDSENMVDLIENVAIATVGDVMDLVDENRIFVKEGLAMLKNTKNLGLQALIESTKVDKERLNSYHIGFVLGPCMNASGRLDTAKRALELLETKTPKEAMLLAEELKNLNEIRKNLTAEALQDAFEQVETTEIGADKVLVIYLPECHESLAGIVAGKVRERYYKPVFVLTKGAEGIKGSGRSIETWHMYEGLNRCKELLKKFGGHKLAAGLSLEENNLEAFRRKVNECSGLEEEDLIEKIHIDMQLPFRSVTESLIEELHCLEPFGKGNVKPVFAERNIAIQSVAIIGKHQNVIKMCVEDEAHTKMEAMYYGDVEAFQEYVTERFGTEALNALLNGEENDVKMAFTYYPDINEYRGEKTLQIVVQNYK